LLLHPSNEEPTVQRATTNPSCRTLLLVVAVALAACGKAQDKAAEKVVEKAIESSMSKDGTSAKVDLSQGAMKVTTTDASGKTTQMEMGSAKISEAELGVPFYPGSQPVEGGGMRMASGDSTALRLALHSDDAPDKVAAFYRDKLKAMSAGKQLIDMSSPEGASLSLMDEKSKSALQVMVGKDDKGSSIMISSSKGAN
jgi:hypothetical protein